RGVQGLELAELDRPRVADMGDGAAEQPQRHFRGQGGEFFGSERDRTALAPGLLAERYGRTVDARLDGGLRAPQPPRNERETVRVEPLARQHGHEAAQPRAGKARVAI